MSDYEAHRGRLILVERVENETDFDYIKRICEEKLNTPFEESKWEDDIREYVSWYLDQSQGFYINNKFYLNTDHKKLDPFEDMQELEGNDIDGYTYFMRFYNGGTCLTEMIEEALEK